MKKDIVSNNTTSYIERREEMFDKRWHRLNAHTHTLLLDILGESLVHIVPLKCCVALNVPETNSIVNMYVYNST